MNPMKGNKDKGEAGQEPGEFIWSGIPEPWAQSQPSPEAAADPHPQSPHATTQQPPVVAAPPQPAEETQPVPAYQPPEQSTPRPNRKVLQVWLAALAVCACGAAVYELGFAGSNTPQPVHAEVQTAASVGALPAPASPSSSPSPSAGATVSLPGYASPSHSAPAAPVVHTSTTKAAKPVVHPTPSVAPTTPASSSSITITTPSPEVTATAATNISGSIQCESSSVEGVWIQSANGGSGWAPWVSSAARSDYATYSYTLPEGGEYAVHVGCGGTTSSWKVAEYSNFYGGTVNNFYCYDESGSSLYTYCARTS
jgi:hypothetical protein